MSRVCHGEGILEIVRGSGVRASGQSSLPYEHRGEVGLSASL